MATFLSYTYWYMQYCYCNVSCYALSWLCLYCVCYTCSCLVEFLEQLVSLQCHLSWWHQNQTQVLSEWKHVFRFQCRIPILQFQNLMHPTTWVSIYISTGQTFDTESTTWQIDHNYTFYLHVLGKSISIVVKYNSYNYIYNVYIVDTCMMWCECINQLLYMIVIN